MKIKAKQWVRYKNNLLYCVSNYNQVFEFKHINGDNYAWPIEELPNLKVADTPQELVQDDDIGFIKEWNSIETLYTSDEGVYCYMDKGRHFIGKNITLTRILTPNGKDYICQWEAKQK